MSFTVHLPQDLFTVSPGVNVAVAVLIENTGAEAIAFEITVEGIDPEWVAIPQPVLTVEPGKTETERIFLKPPRTSESTAGSYPFVVHARSLEDGESKSAQGMIDITAFNHISVDVQPKRGLMTPSRGASEFGVTVLNLGNSDHSLQLNAVDTDDELGFEFNQDRINVGPGQEKTVRVEATAGKKPLLSNSRLHGFTITARSTSNPSVFGTAQGTIEQRAWATPGAVALFMAGILVIVAWILSFPKPPVVDEMILSSSTVQVGQPLRVEWKARNANAVTFLLNGEAVKEATQMAGTYEFTPTAPGDFILSITARRDRAVSKAMTRTFKVVAAPEVPEPRILSFSSSDSQVNLGDSVLLSYSINEAVTSLSFSPDAALNLKPTPRSYSFKVTPTEAGVATYRLIAYNAAGKFVERTVQVTVVKGSRAKIIAFDVNPAQASTEAPNVQVAWQVTNAVRVELLVNGTPQVLESLQGSQTVMLTAATTLVLQAYDAEGLRTKSTVLKVPFKLPDTPVDPPPSPGTDPAGNPEQKQPTSTP